MRVLVTGAAGCVGRAVTRRLRADGHVVRGLDLAARPVDFDGEWMQGDLLATDLNRSADGCGAVIHLAALVHHPRVTDLAAYQRVNVEATRRLLDAARAAGMEPGRFVFSSTVGVYGPDHDFHAHESTPCAPQTPYGVSKLKAEQLVRERGGIILRFPLVYGPGDRGNMAALIRAIARGRFVLPGPCREPRSLVASANAAEGLVRAMESVATTGVYLVTDDDDASVRRLVEAIVAVLPRRRTLPPQLPLAMLWPAAWAGAALERIRLPAPITPDRLRKLTTRLTFSCARAREELGYQPVIALEAGIRQEVDDLLGGGARGDGSRESVHAAARGT